MPRSFAVKPSVGYRRHRRHRPSRDTPECRLTRDPRPSDAVRGRRSWLWRLQPEGATSPIMWATRGTDAPGSGRERIEFLDQLSISLLQVARFLHHEERHLEHEFV